MAEIDGARLVARCLKQQGVDELFGVVGVPVTGIAAAAPSEGIRYIGTRHEQAAGYAAQAMSYLKGRLGACIVGSGPGMTNAISALGNAWANCWPMLLIGGSSNQALNHMGDFQAAPQVELARPFAKWVGQAERIALIPRYIATPLPGVLGQFTWTYPVTLLPVGLRRTNSNTRHASKPPSRRKSTRRWCTKPSQPYAQPVIPWPSSAKGPPGRAPRIRYGVSSRRRRCPSWHRPWVGGWC